MSFAIGKEIFKEKNFKIGPTLPSCLIFLTDTLFLFTCHLILYGYYLEGSQNIRIRRHFREYFKFSPLAYLYLILFYNIAANGDSVGIWLHLLGTHFGFFAVWIVRNWCLLKGEQKQCQEVISHKQAKYLPLYLPITGFSYTLWSHVK